MTGPIDVSPPTTRRPLGLPVSLSEKPKPRANPTKEAVNG